MKITEKGQITIPASIRRQLGLLPRTDVEFVVKGDRAYVQKVRTGRRGKMLIEAMRGRATGGMTTDEVMALTRGE